MSTQGGPRQRRGLGVERDRLAPRAPDPGETPRAGGLGSSCRLGPEGLALPWLFPGRRMRKTAVYLSGGSAGRPQPSYSGLGQSRSQRKDGTCTRFRSQPGWIRWIARLQPLLPPAPASELQRGRGLAAFLSLQGPQVPGAGLSPAAPRGRLRGCPTGNSLEKSLSQGLVVLTGLVVAILLPVLPGKMNIQWCLQGH